MDEAIDNAHQATQLWLETIINDGSSIPPARAISEHYTNPDFSDWIWALIGRSEVWHDAA